MVRIPSLSFLQRTPPLLRYALRMLGAIVVLALISWLLVGQIARRAQRVRDARIDVVRLIHVSEATAMIQSALQGRTALAEEIVELTPTVMESADVQNQLRSTAFNLLGPKATMTIGAVSPVTGINLNVQSVSFVMEGSTTTQNIGVALERLNLLPFLLRVSSVVIDFSEGTTGEGNVSISGQFFLRF